MREERLHLTVELRRRHFEVADSQANFLWVAHPTLDGGELSARLERTGVLVAAGAGLGEPRHVRIACATPSPTTPARRGGQGGTRRIAQSEWES